MEEKRKKLTQEDAKLHAQKQIEDILALIKNPIELHEGRVYITKDITILDKILKVDAFLMEYKSDTARGKKFVLDSFIDIVNTFTNEDIQGVSCENINYIVDCDVVEVVKYPNVTNKTTALKYLPNEQSISPNFHRKRVEQQIEDNEYSEDFKAKLRNNIEELIEEEHENLDDIIKNPANYKEVRLCGYTEKKTYAQLNFKYFEYKNNEKIKISDNKHVSTKKPTIVFFREDIDYEDSKINMQANKLEKLGFEKVARRVYVKRKKP